MGQSTKVVALDIHRDSITVAVADPDRQEPRLYGTTASTGEAVAPLAVEHVDQQDARLPPRRVEPVASLLRPGTRARRPGTHPPAVDADAHPQGGPGPPGCAAPAPGPRPAARHRREPCSAPPAEASWHPRTSPAPPAAAPPPGSCPPGPCTRPSGCAWSETPGGRSPTPPAPGRRPGPWARARCACDPALEASAGAGRGSPRRTARRPATTPTWCADLRGAGPRHGAPAPLARLARPKRPRPDRPRSGGTPGSRRPADPAAAQTRRSNCRNWRRRARRGLIPQGPQALHRPPFGARRNRGSCHRPTRGQSGAVGRPEMYPHEAFYAAIYAPSYTHPPASRGVVRAVSGHPVGGQPPHRNQADARPSAAGARTPDRDTMAPSAGGSRGPRRASTRRLPPT